ncbi:hypothetical protein [Alkaliphilus hydrothermalis]|uniref:Uncharacterized protein n=1 Tax=Alkaliphilus hydrothermalis TaxID=1482730 RepID=A0ABS2NQM7_9FIRM|nr:hypothetical protein [Alkaliphilus hydrothermalis]MBM7615241.1 hypothetical protein [Alkaliphilus hydrothermalis]
MSFISTGTFLLLEWFKTFVIFSIIDRIFIKRKLNTILKNHDTYISSLVVAAFLLILRTQELSIGLFLVWSLVVLVIYTIIRLLFRVLIES